MQRSRTLLTGLRLAAQRMVRPAMHTTVADVVQHSLAMQAQDFPGAKWSVGLRAPGITDADVEAALASRQIVRSWPMRGTLHLTPADDLGWMLRLTAPRLIRGAAKRRSDLGLTDADVERARELAIAALDGGRVLSRDALQQLWSDAGITTTGQRGYHLLWSLSATGTLVFGPVDGKQHTFTLLDEWVAAPRALEIDESLGEWASRYFTSHGPATVKDFAWWASLTLTEARRGVALADLATLDVDGTTHYLAHDLEPAPRSVQLLPGFDEFILGYQDRSAALTPEQFAVIVPGNNGIFQPTIVVNGEVVGTWKRAVKARRVEVQLLPFDSTPAVDAPLTAYGRFLGIPTELARG